MLGQFNIKTNPTKPNISPVIKILLDRLIYQPVSFGNFSKNTFICFTCHPPTFFIQLRQTNPRPILRTERQPLSCCRKVRAPPRRSSRSRPGEIPRLSLDSHRGEHPRERVPRCRPPPQHQSRQLGLHLHRNQTEPMSHTLERGRPQRTPRVAPGREEDYDVAKTLLSGRRLGVGCGGVFSAGACVEPRGATVLFATYSPRIGEVQSGGCAFRR